MLKDGLLGILAKATFFLAFAFLQDAENTNFTSDKPYFC
jgi:hypothetical protein